jgi:hypothetical protein
MAAVSAPMRWRHAPKTTLPEPIASWV